MANKEFKVTSVEIGFIKGSDYNDGKWSIKKVGSNGAGLALGVSSKAKDSDTRVYGKSVDVIVWMENPAEDIQRLKALMENMVAMRGYWKPNNWTKDGKEMKGNQFNVQFEDIMSFDKFKEIELKKEELYQKSLGSKPKSEEADDLGW